jgi:hypothetical protein
MFHPTGGRCAASISDAFEVRTNLFRLFCDSLLTLHRVLYPMFRHWFLASKASGAPRVNRTRPLLQTQTKTHKKSNNHNTTSMFLRAPVGPACPAPFLFSSVFPTGLPRLVEPLTPHDCPSTTRTFFNELSFALPSDYRAPCRCLFSSHSVDCTGPPHPSARLFSSPALHTQKLSRYLGHHSRAHFAVITQRSVSDQQRTERFFITLSAAPLMEW